MESDPRLTPEQLSDAARLDAIYRQWKADRRAMGERVNQETIGHALKMSQSAFSQYCRGVRPVNIELLVGLKNHFGWSPEDISPSLAKKMSEAATAAGAIHPEEHAPVRMVDAKASAGKGEVVFSTDVSKLLMFRRDWLRKNGAKADRVLAFPVAGDSMVDICIPNGSVVLVDMAQKEPIAKRLYVLWIDGELFVKQLVKKGDTWHARSHNASRAQDYPDTPVVSTDDRIVGRAFWCGFGL